MQLVSDLIDATNVAVVSDLTDASEVNVSALFDLKNQ